MNQAEILENIKALIKNGLGTPVLLTLMIAMMVLPLPPLALDMLFTFNISFALIVLLAGIYCKKPLDFAVFPTILLISTLLRLGLNIASTRVVLLNGHTGTGAAGQVIESFGEVVVGGNYAVGFAIFIILIIINFVVVTKGAGRISEVSARFTLDAMPGKQMGIDADLNAGIITQEQAIARREEISKESDFYGSMDGASKFVRGDAIAGILILIINLLGGVFIGVMQNDMTFSGAMTNYGLLTIGDGLVAQIPSILLSTAAAIMVTRVSKEEDMGDQVATQMFQDPKILAVTAMVLFGFGIIPGMPHFAFLSLSALLVVGIFIIKHFEKKKEVQVEQQQQEEEEQQNKQPEVPELSWDDVAPVDVIGLEIGYRLIPLVDKNQNGQLMIRIKGIRKKLSQELGFLIPSVHIRDNLDLTPNAYRITLMGVTIAQADVLIDKELAINPGHVVGVIDGTATKDPAFGLDAVWIEPSLREQAQTLGYTVVDVSTVIATHLSHVMQEHAAELLGYDEVTELLGLLDKSSPKLAENMGDIPTGVILRVLQNLLKEDIPIRDFKTIAETISDCYAKNPDTEVLTIAVRSQLNRLIVQNINGIEEEVPVITLDPDLERILQQSLHGGEGATIEPGLAERLQRSLKEAAMKQETIGQPAVLLVPGQIRSLLSRFLRASIQGLHVLSYHEVPDNKQIRVVATIGA